MRSLLPSATLQGPSTMLQQGHQRAFVAFNTTSYLGIRNVLWVWATSFLPSSSQMTSNGAFTMTNLTPLSPELLEGRGPHAWDTTQPQSVLLLHYKSHVVAF